MTIPASTVPVISGNAPTFGTPTASDLASIGTTLIVKNGSASTVTVTLITPSTLPTGDAYPDKAYTIPAAGERWIPVLPDYRDPNDGAAHITFSATTSVTAAQIIHS
ncbi:hypothetical protein C6401_15190 [Arthrobacter woluwensis]|uniref:hypothetical protein n=1 Tax=Arthrobacter woluwensis TaxID=156980 RepID=UPI000D11D8AF|nr:hypothetical protein [Arthrobacter woluwensis]PSS42902.1 hypothetical protein C6401_15190 [Arthrobacter woluwensis]